MMQGWWLGAATSVAVVSGLGGAFLVAQGRFLGGGALLMLSVVSLRWPRSFWAAEPAPELPLRTRRLGLLAVCAVAVFFRFYKLEPPGIWGDDAINGLLAFDVLDGKITSPFQLVAHSYSIFHALTNYTIAGAFWLFGPGPATLRLPGVIAGALAAPLLYGTMSPLFGARVALVAALFLASSPLQISHSKVLIQVMLGEFFLLLGMCALVQGLARGRRWLVALAGVPMALSLYTYHSAKLAPALAVVFFVIWWWKGAANRRALLSDFASFLGIFVLCAIPAVWSYVEMPAALTGRAKTLAVWSDVVKSGSLQPLWNGVWRTLLVFHYQQGPIYHWVGIGSDPAVNVVIACLLVHGMVESLRHGATPRHTLLLIWVFMGLIPGLLSEGAPRVYRVLLASPPLYVWAAMPIVQIALCARQVASPRRWLLATAALLVLSVPVIDFNYYFYRVYTNREFRWYQSARLVEMARRLRALGPGWTGYVVANGFVAGYEPLAFLSRAWGLTLRDVGSLANVLPVHDAPSGGALFILDRDSIEPVGALLRSLYPSVDLELYRDPPARAWWFDRWLPLATDHQRSPIAAFFPVSRQSADAIRGVTVTFLGADGQVILTRVDRQLGRHDLRVPPQNAATPGAAKWSGMIYAPSDGRYTFIVDPVAKARVWMDGSLLVSDEQPRAERRLAQGLHQFAAEAGIKERRAFDLRWVPPGADAPTSLPPTLLFRGTQMHGLRADYQFPVGTLQRIEPYPYYDFFTPRFPSPFTVRWRGQLRVPPPGGYRIEAVTNRHTTLRVDGRQLRPRESLAAGVHDLEIDIGGILGRTRLQLFWQRRKSDREWIPPQAFTPPNASR